MAQVTKVEIWVHGAPARCLDQVVKYLTGDVHDQTKVEIFVNTGDVKTSLFRPFPFTPFDEDN